MKSSFSLQYGTPKKKSPWKSDTVAQGVNMERSLHVSKFPLILFEIIMYTKLRVSVSDLDIASKPWNSEYWYTAISREVVGKHVHTTIPKSNMGYNQYTVPDTVAVEPTFVAFL